MHKPLLRLLLLLPAAPPAVATGTQHLGRSPGAVPVSHTPFAQDVYQIRISASVGSRA